LAAGDTTPGRAQPLVLRPARRRFKEDGVRAALLACAVVSVATTVGILVALFVPAIEFFREVDVVDYITGTRWAPLFSNPDFGVLPLVVGTVSITLWAMVVCIPCGLATAIYLSEYASPRVRNWIKPTLEVLAGVPTVVLGYFALLFVSPLLQDIGIDVGTFSALSAGLVVGVMLIPTVASISEDAMSAVPHDLRAGAYALGSTKVKVALRVVVPAAISGIIASFVLAFSRAIGETMIVLIGAGGRPNLTFNPLEPVQTMTAFIGATGGGDVPTGSIEYKTIFAVGLTLFVMTLVVNMVAIRMVRKYREIYE
jgi:phosphate transport system permease protein